MSQKKRHFILLSGCLVCCILMLADISILPTYTEHETITEVNKSTSGNRINAFTNFTVVTGKETYDVTAAFYLVARVGDEVAIVRSSLTNSKKEIQFVKNEFSYTEKLGYTSQPIGIIFLSTMALINLGAIIFYDKMTYPPAKGNITYFLVLCMFLFLLMHLVF